MKKFLIILLILIAFVMFYLGIKANMLPPVLTGAGFSIIAGLFWINDKK